MPTNDTLSVLQSSIMSASNTQKTFLTAVLLQYIMFNLDFISQHLFYLYTVSLDITEAHLMWYRMHEIRKYVGRHSGETVMVNSFYLKALGAFATHVMYYTDSKLEINQSPRVSVDHRNIYRNMQANTFNLVIKMPLGIYWKLSNLT